MQMSCELTLSAAFSSLSEQPYELNTANQNLELDVIHKPFGSDLRTHACSLMVLLV